eukprot:1891508-Lingulodinium_polyedra.AAC.1
MAAGAWHDEFWHTRLLIIISIAMELGVYKSFQEVPLWGGPVGCAAKLPDDDQEEKKRKEEQKAAQALPK